MSVLGSATDSALSAVQASETRAASEPTLVPEQARARNWDLWALGTVLLGAAMRFIGLGRQSMWYDELFTLAISMKSLPRVIEAAAADTSPPLFYVAEHFVSAFIGKNEVATRFLPALAGVLTIWIVYLVGNRLFGKRTSFWAATLFAISYMPIRYAQEARAYSFLMLFAALGLWTLLRLADRPGALNALAFALALAALAYTHVYGVFGGTALVMAMLLVPRLRRRAGWWGVAAALLAAASFVPWGLVILDQIKTVKGWAQSGSWPLKRPTNLLHEFWLAIESFTPWAYPKLLTAVAFSATLLAGLWGLLSTRVPLDAQPAERQPPTALQPTDRDIVLLLAICVTVPIVLALGLSMTVMPIQELRGYLVCAPAVYLLAAHGALRLRSIGSLALLTVLLSSALVGIPQFYATHNKGYFREATEYLLSKNAQDGRLIVSSNHLPLNLNMYCIIKGYDRQFGLDKVDYLCCGEELDGELKSLLKDRTSVWIVTAFVPTDDDGSTTFDASMKRQDGWRLAESQDFDGRPKVQRWVRDPDGIQ